MNGSATKVLLASAIFLAFACSVSSEGRTVVGRITRLDPAARTFTVTDGVGTGWNFKVYEGSGIDISTLKVGDRVEVRIARATPPNMISAADVLKKGDRVVPAAGY